MAVPRTNCIVASLSLSGVGKIRAWKIRGIVLSEQYLESGKLLSVTIRNRHIDLDLRIIDVVAWPFECAFCRLTNLNWCEIFEGQGYPNTKQTC